MVGFKGWLLGGACAALMALAPGLVGAEGPPMSALNPNAPAPQGFLGPTFEGPWRFRAALNGWLPTAINICVDARVEGDCTQEDLRWILNRLKYIFPIDLEVRKGSFGLFVHSFIFRLAGSHTAGPATIDWDDTFAMVDVGVSYELGRWRLGSGSRAPELTVEPFVEARLIWDPIDITFPRLGLSPVLDLTNFLPVLGVRGFLDLTEHWNLQVLGDYGGFGVDDNHQTFQVVGLVGYRWPGWGAHWNLQVGYRAQRIFDLRRRGVEIRMDFRGPNVILGVEF